ncbi:MAG: hypothetical protein P1V81_00720 [Planctomycetota bacterium]|nr:hypothetical protein [Planctomycetota bacterium]
MVHLVRRLVLPAVLLLAGSLSASASGLVQIVIRGQIEESGGAPIQLKLKADGSELSFRGLLAYGTRSGDLAALFERRLKGQGIRYSLGPAAAPRGEISLFIEDVEAITVRLGGGLTASVTSVEEVPDRLRLLPPNRTTGQLGGEVGIFVTSEVRGTGVLSQAALSLDLPNTKTTSAWVSEQLSRRAIGASMRSSRPTPDSWTSTGTTSGGEAIAMSVRLYADSDWGVEMTLSPRVNTR